jgi:hypothetical protein
MKPPVCILLAWILWVVASIATTLGGESAAKPAPTGCAVGAEVPFFYARAITGPDSGKTLCYVCKYEHRPVVLVFVRQFEDGLDTLLQELDREVDQQWKHSLRAGVFFCGQPSEKLQPKLVNLSRDLELTIPLAVPAEFQTGPSNLQLDQEAAVTLVVYRDRKVVQAYRVAPGKLTVAKARALVQEASKALLAP